MSTLILPGLLGFCLALAPLPPERPDLIDLLADDPAYRAAPGPEGSHEGYLEYQKGYYLDTGPGADGRPVLVPVHLPRGGDALALHVGRRVRITGKLVGARLWPARLRLVVVKGADADRPPGVLARCTWRPVSAERLGRQTFVFRDGGQLASALGVNGPTRADTASSLLARHLRVPALDWSRHMLVVISAGLRTDGKTLAIQRAAVEGDTLVVRYTLAPPPDERTPPGLSYPAETALVPRFTGPVRFELVPSPGK